MRAPPPAAACPPPRAGQVSAGFVLTSTDSARVPFNVTAGALAFEVNVTMESDMFLVGTSAGTVRVLTPDDHVLAEAEFGINAGGSDEVLLEGAFNATGEHHVEVELDSGAITYSGEIRVLFAAPAQADDGDDADG